ncbi:Arm DNA-binding domain-containing protein [Maribacter sp. 2-571]|uniref:Arm DNA-binding domain-containing protein n=1 Tax=Maribacter sp. 2-571 TaxID=3417569 RepID=UPI003D332098
MKNVSLAILCYLRGNRLDKQGRAQLYFRITVNGRRSEFSLGRKITPEKWCSTRGRVKGTEGFPVHLYANRIGFDGRAYKDSFIGKRSQLAAEKVAKEMGLTTAREVRQEKLLGMKGIRNEIKQIHDTVMEKERPKDFDSYFKSMQKYNVKVIPFINKGNKLQGFRFEYKGHNLKGSAVHRSLSGGKIALAISNNSAKGLTIGEGQLAKL